MSDFVAKSFIALPHRCLTDKSFRLRHFKVLGAICRAMQADTGSAKMGQERIASLAGMDRRNARKVITELADMGYIEVLRQPSTWRGRRACTVYNVKYQSESEADHHGAESTPRSMALRTRHHHGAESTPVTKPLDSKPFLECKHIHSAPPVSPPESNEQDTEPTNQKPKTKVALQESTEAATTTLPSPSAPKQRELPVHQVVAGIDHEAKRKQFAEQQSRAAEQRRRERVEGRWLQSLVQTDMGGEVLAVLPQEIQDKATDAELARKGAGLPVIVAWWQERKAAA